MGFLTCTQSWLTYNLFGVTWAGWKLSPFFKCHRVPLHYLITIWIVPNYIRGLAILTFCVCVWWESVCRGGGRIINQKVLLHNPKGWQMPVVRDVQRECEIVWDIPRSRGTSVFTILNKIIYLHFSFLPEASFGLRVLSSPASVCVCPCVCQSMCQSLACPRDNSGPVQARIAKFRPKMQQTLFLRSLLFWGAIDLDLQGQN